ncbi:unnamed protein product [Boreogadus saida]
MVSYCLPVPATTHASHAAPPKAGRESVVPGRPTDRPSVCPISPAQPIRKPPGSLHNGSCPPKQSRRDDLRSATPSLPHTSPCPPSPGVFPMESTLILEGSSIHGASMPAIDTRVLAYNSLTDSDDNHIITSRCIGHWHRHREHLHSDGQPGVQGERVGAGTVTGRWVDSHHRAEGWNICRRPGALAPTGGDP